VEYVLFFLFLLLFLLITFHSEFSPGEREEKAGPFTLPSREEIYRFLQNQKKTKNQTSPISPANLSPRLAGFGVISTKARTRRLVLCCDPDARQISIGASWSD
jgi:hypothetical protein